MKNKDQTLLAEAYENIMQSQHNKSKELFYKNVMNKFMNESINKNIQGFEGWFKNQMQEDNIWNNDKLFQEMYKNLKSVLPSNTTELYEELFEFVSRNIGTDDRAWQVEA
jgi:hypothetical protein